MKLKEEQSQKVVPACTLGHWRGKWLHFSGGCTRPHFLPRAEPAAHAYVWPGAHNYLVTYTLHRASSEAKPAVFSRVRAGCRTILHARPRDG